MRICILETDRPSDDLIPEFGTYADMFERWLGPALPEAAFSRVHIQGGERMPDPGAVDGVLLTGSRCSVYDGHGWIDELKRQLVVYRDARTPVGGVCFGHQVMAAAWGGTVAKSGRGWGLGRAPHRVSAAGRSLLGGRDELHLLSVHQDQVTSIPPGTEVLVGNDHSPHGALSYGFPALSVQFHPEFSHRYVAALLDRGIGPSADHPDTLAARGSLSGHLDGQILAQSFAMFFRNSVSVAP